MKLLFIVARGLQAGALGSYGNRWAETSCLDALAAAGVVFDQHIALHPVPEAARRAWRSGRHQFAESAPQPDVLELLKPRGIPARLIVDESRGAFAEFESGWPRVERAADADGAFEMAREALAAGGDSWLVWLDLAALLPPWRVPRALVEAYFSDSADDEDEEDDDEEVRDYIPPEEPLSPLLDPPAGPIGAKDDRLYLQLRQTYAAAVSHLDGRLGDLLDGLADDVHLILTSDGGLALGEHGVVGAIPSLHNESVHVPLLIYGHGCRPGRRIEALTGSIDLAPTIAEWAGVALGEAQGISLVPYLSGGAAAASRDYLCLGCGDDVGLRSREWAMLRAAAAAADLPRLFARPDDPYEVNDLGQNRFDEAEKLERTSRAYVEAALKPGPWVPPPRET